MRIGILSLTYHSGGVGGHSASLAESLARLGHSITVFASGGSRAACCAELGVDVVDLKIGLTWGFPTTWSRLAKMKLSAYHTRTLRGLEVLNGNPVLGDYVKGAKRLGVPYVATLHGSLRILDSMVTQFASPSTKNKVADRLVRRIDSGIEHREYRLAGRVVANSVPTLQQYKELYGPRVGCCVIPPCISPVMVNPPGEDLQKNSDKTKEEEATVLLIGVDHPVKGLAYGIRAFRILSKSMGRVKLVVVTDAAERWLGAIKNLGMAKQTVIHNLVPHNRLISLFRSSQIMIYPSIYEGFGMLLAEAMFSGLPAVAFNTPSAAALIKDQVNGCLVPLGDVETMAERIGSLLSDEGKRRRLGDQARQYAMSGLHPDRVAREYVRAYESAISDSDWRAGSAMHAS